MKLNFLKRYNKKGFTLIELLMVIVIISILAVLAVNAYIYARYKGLLNLQSEKVIESVRRAKYEITRGESEGGPVCKGVKIVKGSGLVETYEAAYKGDRCDDFSLVGNAYALTTPIIFGDVKVNGVSEEEVFVYFVPPDAEMFVDGNTKNKVDVTVQFGDKDENEWQRGIGIDPLTNVVQIKTIND